MCPCKDCKKRKIGCHAECKEYKTWRKQNIYLKRKNKQLNVYSDSYQEKEHIRYLKRHS